MTSHTWLQVCAGTLQNRRRQKQNPQSKEYMCLKPHQYVIFFGLKSPNDTSASRTYAHVSQNICVHWYVRVKIYQYISVHVDHYVERAQTYWRESCRKERAQKNPPRVCKYTYIHQPVKNGKYVNTSKNKFALISICKCAYILAGELLKRRRQPKTTCRPDAELHVNIYTDIHMYLYIYIYIIYIYHTYVYANIYLCIHIYIHIYVIYMYIKTKYARVHIHTHIYIIHIYAKTYICVYIYI